MSTIEVLKKIHKADGPVAASDIGVTAARLRKLEGEGLVTRPKVKGEAAVRKTGGRGRPSHLYKLTSKATKRVKRELEKKSTPAKSAPKAQAEAPAAA